MKFRLEHEKKEKEVVITTKTCISDGEILIKGRLPGGDNWNLLRISEKGIFRCRGVGKELGLSLDGIGRLKIEN